MYIRAAYAFQRIIKSIRVGGGGGGDLGSIASIVRRLNTLSTGSSLIDCGDCRLVDGRYTFRALRVVELDCDCGITTNCHSGE